MDQYHGKREDNFFLTFSDLTQLAKKNKRKIAFGALVMACLAIFYGVTKSIEYQAEATFKEKGKSQSGLGKTFSEFFLVGDSQDSDALTIMRSRRLIERLVQSCGLQATVVKEEHRFPYIPLERIKDNLLTEYALFNNLRGPLLKDPIADLSVKNISYKGETPLGVKLRVRSQETFVIINAKDEFLGECSFGHPFHAKEFSFVITPNTDDAIDGNEYIIVFQPLGTIAKHIVKQFTIETDRNDKSLLKILYKNRNRHHAAEHINALMSLYQEYVKEEHQRLCGLQVDYLIQRQNEMGRELEKAMLSHAQDLSSDLSITGFATSEKAMDFLAASQQDFKQKLLSIDLEIQRLENFQQERPLDYEKLNAVYHSDTVSGITSEVRSLKQQADSLNLALRSAPPNQEAFQKAFLSQVEELEEIKQCAKEAKLMLASLDKDQIPQNFLTLINHPKFIVKTWYERLINSKNNPSIHKSQNNWIECKEGFTAYLSHLLHYLDVYQRNIEERLTYQQKPLEEFQGISLITAKELYITYSKELSNVESQTIQQRFIIGQISNPEFEISSLSTVLSDPISTDMISKASSIVLALKDHENRSHKEQERLKADLIIQKNFLTAHLEQAVLLLELRQKFLQEKIQNLQSINLSLIQEQISILENQLENFATSSIINLKQEQSLLEKNLAEMRMEMATLPQKWAAEQLIEQQMEINKSMVAEISKLIESKNITSNLEKIQSAPIDLPIVPIHPKSPQLILLAIIGAIAGSFLSFAIILTSSVVHGVKASSSSLSLNGFHVSGSLSRHYQIPSETILDSDLNTLRRLIAFIVSPHAKDAHQTLLLLESKGPNYAFVLAELMSKMNLKLLIIDLSFNDAEGKHQPGLLQYLENKAAEPKIIHAPSYDFIPSGGICRYANELICSQPFRGLLATLRQHYDWILVYSNASPISAQSESLLDQFPNAAISISDESLSQLKSCFAFANKPNQKISFIFTEL